MKKKLLSKGLLFFLLAGFAAELLASPAYLAFLPKNSTWLTSLSLGPAWSGGGKSQTLKLAPGIEKRYQAKSKNSALMTGEWFLGLQKTLSEQWLAELGLAIASSTRASFAGAIWDDADPVFNNASYHYKVSQTRLALKTKLRVNQDYWLTPWLSLSLGLSLNKAQQFVNTPKSPEFLTNPNFASHRNSAFSYTFGAGLQRALTKHWQLGLGYEFADWGRARLGAAKGQVLPNYLRLRHVYVNGLLFSLSYIA